MVRTPHAPMCERDKALLISGPLAILSAVLLYNFFDIYVLSLAFFFMFVVFAAHFWLAYVSPISGKFLKRLEYAYLGPAVLGIFIAVYTSSSERLQTSKDLMRAIYLQESVNLGMVIAQQEEICKLSAQLSSDYTSYMQVIISNKYCSIVNNDLQILKRNDLIEEDIRSSREKLEIIKQKNRWTIESLLADILQPSKLFRINWKLPPTITITLFDREFSTILSDQVLIYLEQNKQKPSAAAEEISIDATERLDRLISAGHSAFRAWIWPFFVLLGIAIKIAKVTADVRGWVAD